MGGGRRRVHKRHGQLHRLLLLQGGGDAAQGPLGRQGEGGRPVRGAVQEVVLAVRRGRELDAELAERVYEVPVLGAGAAGRQGRGREWDVHLRPQR